MPSVVVVRTVRGKYVSKEKGDTLQVGESTPVLQAPVVELPIPRGTAGPGLLADTIVKRWVEHQPLHRMERTYGREAYDVNRSTICGWHEALALLTAPIVVAMWEDARRNSAYLCTDATGVLVQDIDKCRRAHFFVVVAPEVRLAQRQAEAKAARRRILRLVRRRGAEGARRDAHLQSHPVRAQPA